MTNIRLERHGGVNKTNPTIRLCPAAFAPRWAGRAQPDFQSFQEKYMQWDCPNGKGQDENKDQRFAQGVKQRGKKKHNHCGCGETMVGGKSEHFNQH